MGKLVRDKIPEIIEASGGLADVRRLDDGAFRRALCEKLYEEAGELQEAANAMDVLDEAADVLEVVRALASAYGHDFADVVRAAEEKREMRGGFDARIWLEPLPSADTSEGIPAFVIDDYLLPLITGDLYRFEDWPNPKIRLVEPGVYTIWEGDQLIYVGYAGRKLTAKYVSTLDQATVKKAKGLRDRLDHHASGARSGDQFCVYVCDRFVLAALTEEDRAAIQNGDLRLLNALTRKHIRDRYSYRFVPTPDGPTARKLELAVQKGALGAKPLLNPR